MMTTDNIVKIRNIKGLLTRRFGQVRVASPTELRVECPYCKQKNDKYTDYKLYVNPIKSVFNCFRCDTRGPLVILLPQLMSLDFSLLNTSAKITVQNEKTPVETLPVGTPLALLPHEHPAKLYLDGRGYSFLRNATDIFFVDNYIRGHISFGARIVFPIFQSGTYRGFQGRAIQDNQLPKYIGASNMEKKKILYNLDRVFQQKNLLVIVEGIFDALKIPEYTIALLGKHVSEEQERIIPLGGFKKILVFLDKDAEREAKETAYKFSCYHNTYIVRTPYKDLGEIPREDAISIINTDKYLERIW